jgi:hypothetical protein
MRGYKTETYDLIIDSKQSLKKICNDILSKYAWDD